MNFGEIIKKAWRITWRYRALWVLSLFAGISGWTGGGSGGSSSSSSGTDDPASYFDTDISSWLSSLERAIPMILTVILVLLIIGLVWGILGLAARSGLVHAVNEIEEGRTYSLGAAWQVGFDRFWRMVGLGLLLNLPIGVLGLAFTILVLAPIMLPLIRGAEPTGAIVAPVCGGLAVGIPVLVVVSLILGILYVIATRFVVLYDMGVMQAIGEAWRAFRARTKDHVLMWLVNFGLNVAAGIVFAIPVTLLALAIALPAFVAGSAGEWSALAGVVVVLVIVILALSLLYTGIWGTFTSSLWTIFFRRLVGMEKPVQPTFAAAAPTGWGYAPPMGASYPPPADSGGTDPAFRDV
jgi:hypothetical protein